MAEDERKLGVRDMAVADGEVKLVDGASPNSNHGFAITWLRVWDGFLIQGS
jgi:hypothetical protein